MSFRWVPRNQQRLGSDRDSVKEQVSRSDNYHQVTRPYLEGRGILEIRCRTHSLMCLPEFCVRSVTGITCKLEISTLGPSPVMITSRICRRNWLAIIACECAFTARSTPLQLIATNKVVYRSSSLVFQDMMI